MVGREKPEMPCDQILSEEEWRVLSAWATGKMADTAPERPTGDALDRQARRLAGPRKRRQSGHDLHVARSGSLAKHGPRLFVGSCKFMASEMAHDPQS